MDPTHPDFFRRADRAPRRPVGPWRLGLLLPLAAALPLVVTVVRHWPAKSADDAKPSSAAFSVSLPPLEHEMMREVPAEEIARLEARAMERAKSHVVVPGETLSGIAQRHGCDPGKLATTNGLDPRGTLTEGTILLLPRPAEVAAQAPVRKRAEPVLTPIPAAWTQPAAPALQAPAPPVGPVGPVGATEPAALAQVSSAQVRSPNYPFVPQPTAAEADEPVPGPVQPVSGAAVTGMPKVSIQYLVQPGDRLETIAAAHFTSVPQLMRLNRIDGVTAGQVIAVPVDQCLIAPR